MSTTYYGGAVTVLGRDLLASLMGGDTLELTRVQVGSGQMPEGVEPMDMTALAEPVALGTSTEPVVDGNTLSLTVEYRNDLNGGLETGFWLREFGVFAKTENHDEVLLYYATLGDSPQPVSAFREDRIDTRRFPISISLTLDPEVTVTYNPGGFITSGEAQSYLSALVRQATRNSGLAYRLDITVPAAGWTALDTPMGGYGYRCDVAVEEALAGHYPAIALDPPSLETAEAARLCASVEAIDGYVRLWAKAVPSGDLTGTLALVRGGASTPEESDNQEEIKLALLQLLKKAVYVDETGNTVVRALEYAMYNGQTRVYYPVSNGLDHVTSTNPATAAYAFGTYQANLIPDSYYAMETVTVTMGGTDITASAYSDGAVLIQSVTGPIEITASAAYQGQTVYSLSGTDFSYGVGNQNTAPSYTKTLSNRASYAAFDLSLEPGATYSFTFVSADGTGAFGTQFYNRNVLDAVHAGRDFSNNDQYDPGWHEEGQTYTYTVGTVNDQDIIGVRIAVRNGGNSAITEGYIQSLTITKEAN